MPELGSYGSVRGALSNERLYRDLGAPKKQQFQNIARGAEGCPFGCCFMSGQCPKNAHPCRVVATVIAIS